MRNEENLVGSVLFILGVAALGYAMHVTSKMNKLCAKLDLSVDELSESIDISMPDAIVKEAVDRAADRAAYKAVQSATVTAVNQVVMIYKKKSRRLWITLMLICVEKLREKSQTKSVILT